MKYKTLDILMLRHLNLLWVILALKNTT